MADRWCSDQARYHGQGLSAARGTIRETFQGWLAVVVSVAYMVSAAIGYTGVSATCLYEADTDMLGGLCILRAAVETRQDARCGSTSTKLADHLEEVHTASIGSVRLVSILITMA